MVNSNCTLSYPLHERKHIPDACNNRSHRMDLFRQVFSSPGQNPGQIKNYLPDESFSCIPPVLSAEE